MDAGAIAMSVFSNAIVAFSRSSGPGGQNVNKVNTKVTASIALEKIEGLSQAERIAVKARLSGRIRGDGVLQVRVQETRNQGRNREIALELIGTVISGFLWFCVKIRPFTPDYDCFPNPNNTTNQNFTATPISESINPTCFCCQVLMKPVFSIFRIIPLPGRRISNDFEVLSCSA
ncbi:hypothetical protein SPIRO4BDMA_40006 [uncultured spirochete]|uniref:Prokaryotic-type class I peptide chain release factors domain-containing protein n=1 Tax=uncultured spirochete TaxID=156406 RepID=A0A3P3XMA8_9SPIR|nr:hypothetical protein SPIRO4BDMA_40006 [uncultured spirochete]